MTWPAMEEMWMTAFGFWAETAGEEERKWDMASWVVRMGWIRFMESEA